MSLSMPITHCLNLDIIIEVKVQASHVCILCRYRWASWHKMPANKTNITGISRTLSEVEVAMV